MSHWRFSSVGQREEVVKRLGLPTLGSHEKARCFCTGFCLEALDCLLPNQEKPKSLRLGLIPFTNKIKCKHAFDVQAVS